MKCDVCKNREAVKTIQVHTENGPTEALAKTLQNGLPASDELHYIAAGHTKLMIVKLQEYGSPEDDIYAWKTEGSSWNLGKIDSILEDIK
jgi:hypothetical protein